MGIFRLLGALFDAIFAGGTQQNNSAEKRYDPYDPERLKRDDPGLHRYYKDEGEKRG